MSASAFPAFGSSVTVDDLLTRLTQREKVKLLGAKDYWHTSDISRLNIPSLRTSDGPNGVRGQQYFDGAAASCIPCATALASTFDTALVRELGELLGDDCREKGVHILLGPTVNIQRTPNGGRGFESFSEDPHLSGILATEYIRGVQSKKVACSIKHFVCNDQEINRHSISADVDERTLRELYLRPFEIAIKGAAPKLVMTGYNALNGRHCSEHEWLLRKVLREDWSFSGAVISDWFGTYSTSGAMNAGLDLEFPSPAEMRGGALLRAMKAGKVTRETLDERTRKVLELVEFASQSGIAPDAEESAQETEYSRSLLRRAAGEAVVLLKNENRLLPLSPSKLSGKRLALIGQNVTKSSFCGGGSAILTPYRAVSPLEGIEAALAQYDVDIVYEQGCATFRYLPDANEFMTSLGGRKGYYTVSFYNDDPASDPSLQPVHQVEGNQPELMFAGIADSVDAIHTPFFARLEATFDVPEDAVGAWEFGLCVAGTGDVRLDDRLLIDNTKDQVPGLSFYGLGTEEKVAQTHLEAGKHTLQIRFESDKAGGGGLAGNGGLRFGGRKIVDENLSIATAADVASSSDLAIIVVGLNDEFEGEGFDRPTLDIPGKANDLVAAVLKAQPNSVIVLQGGTPLAMPWIQEAPAVLFGWYGGNELGHALADVLFGSLNPSAKLPVTFPVSLDDCLPIKNGAESYPGIGGHVQYMEKLSVGYRAVRSGTQCAPLFAFGHGLSYTSFKYEDLEAPREISSGGDLVVTMSVKNVGSTAGKESVQLYIQDLKSSVERPSVELRGFAKTATLKAGESQKLSFTLDRTAWAFFSDGKWRIEAGDFQVLVAESSAPDAQTLSATVTMPFPMEWQA